MMSRIETRRLFPPPSSSSSSMPLSRRVFHLQENSLQFRVLWRRGGNREHRKISRATIGGRCCFAWKLKNVVQKSMAENLVHSLYLLVRGGKTDNKTFPPHFSHFKAATCDPSLPPFWVFLSTFFPRPKNTSKATGEKGGRERQETKKSSLPPFSPFR